MIAVTVNDSYSVELSHESKPDPSNEGHRLLRAEDALELVTAWVGDSYLRNWWAEGEEDYEPFVFAWLQIDSTATPPGSIRMETWKAMTLITEDETFIGFSTADFPAPFTVTITEE